MAGTVTYFCYDLINNQLLAVLPFTNVSFGLRFNTPGSFSARDVSMPRMRARACGLFLICACSMPGNAMSSI